MTTLILKSSEKTGNEEGLYKVYINPAKNNTPDGEPRRAEIFFNVNGVIEKMYTTYQNGHRFLGGDEIETAQCPSDIILQD